MTTDARPRKNPADYPPFRDGKRFHVHRDDLVWQVGGMGCDYICICDSADAAQMIADALELAANNAQYKRSVTAK